MPDTQTAADIQAELATVRATIQKINGQHLAGEDLGNKNVAYASAAKLTALYDRERELMRRLASVERGGIRVRSGIIASLLLLCPQLISAAGITAIDATCTTTSSTAVAASPTRTFIFLQNISDTE